MLNVNVRAIIQKYDNLKEYYPELTSEELQKIEEVKSLLKDREEKRHFFFRRKTDLERKRISIIERAADILYELLREERAYKNRDHELEFLVEFSPETYLSRAKS